MGLPSPYSIDLFSALGWCLRVVGLSGIDGVVAWTGTAVAAVTGWFLMQAWVYGWNRQWDSMLPVTLQLVFALATAVAVLVSFGAWNLKRITVEAVHEMGDHLRSSTEFGVEVYRRELEAIGIDPRKNQRNEAGLVQDSENLCKVLRVTDKAVHEAFGENLVAFTSDLPAESPAAGSAAAGSTFTVSLENAGKWIGDALDHATLRAEEGARHYADAAAWFVIGWVAKVYVGFSVLVGLLIAWRAYAAIFRFRIPLSRKGFS